MTDQTEYRPLGWRDPEWYAYGVKDGVTWMTQKFASWFATAWLYLILWAVVLIAFTVLLYIDGIFSRSLAPDSVEPLSFQAMGWAYRLFAASFLMASARCAHKGIKGGWTFGMLGAFASVIVCLHAFGFGFEALSERRDQAMAERDVSGVAEQSIADQRAFLEERKGQIDSDLETALIPLNAEIYNLDNDGKLNEELTAQMRDRRTQLQDQAAADKRAIDNQIMQLVVNGSQARTETIETEALAQPWHPLFVGLAQLANQTWEPTNNQIYIAAIVFIIFWVLLAESLVIFLPERIYSMHLRDAELARQSDAARKGWETRRQKAERKDPNHTTPPQVEDTGYWQQRIMKALNNKMKRPTAKGLADSYFNGMSVEELRGRLLLHLKRGLVLVPATKSAPEVKLTHDHIDFIMREGEYAPEEQMTNGHDKSKGDNSDEDDTGTDQLPAVN